MANIAAVLQAHHRRLLAVQNAAGANIGAAWDRLANVDKHSAEQFTKAAAAISSASVAATAALSNSMYTVLAPDTDGDVPPVVIRNGVDPADLYQRSIVTARTVLSVGGVWLAAMSAGRARAVSTARTDVLLANRAAGAAEGSARPEISGYSRLLNPGACAYCASLADETYGSADDVPLHNGCGCSVSPIIGGRDPAKALNLGLLASMKHDSDSTLVDRGYVSADGDPIDPQDTSRSMAAVHEHGEMGAVIRPAGEHFETAADEED